MKGLAVLLAVVVGVLAGFWGGLHVSRTSTTAVATNAAAVVPTAVPTTNTGGAAGNGGRGPGPGGAGRGISGTVTALTATGFTVHNPATGTDVKVTFEPSTPIRKMVAGQASDLVDGSTVAVAGPAGADGTIAAASITVTPAGAG